MRIATIPASISGTDAAGSSISSAPRWMSASVQSSDTTKFWIFGTSGGRGGISFNRKRSGPSGSARSRRVSRGSPFRHGLRVLAAHICRRRNCSDLLMRKSPPFACSRIRNRRSPPERPQELLDVVQPYIFGRGDRLTHQKRLALQAKWIYQAGFLKRVERSLDRNEARWRRLVRLAWFSAANPRVMTAPGFWQRVPGFDRSATGRRLSHEADTRRSAAETASEV